MASFRNVYTSLLLVIAGSTDRELARQVNYLKAENQILRSRLPGRISLTEREKNRLIRLPKISVRRSMSWPRLFTPDHPSLDSRSRSKIQGAPKRQKRPSPDCKGYRETDPKTGQRQFLGLHQDPRRAEETGDRIGNAQHGQKHSQTQWLRVWPYRVDKGGRSKCKILMLDNDAKYSKLFMDAFEKGKNQNPTNSDPISEHGRLCRTIRSNDQARMSRSFRRFWPQTHGPSVPRIQRLLSRRRTAASGTGERACD